MERQEKETYHLEEEWDIEELMPNGEWECEMPITEYPIVNRFHTSVEDAKAAIKLLKKMHPRRKYRIYHWITTTTTNWVGEEEWLDETGKEASRG